MEAGEEARRAGRNLVGMSKTGTTITYTYNKDGIRTSKTVNGVMTQYTLNGDKVTAETDGTDSIIYRYDSNDKLISMNLNGIEYYYFRNAQGDIVGLFDRLGNVVVEYTYDAWGSILSTTGSLANTVGVMNPYRYRGYRIDANTGMYYLQSRYYNINWNRFLNSDDVLFVNISSLFNYSSNNPVNMIDEYGFAPAWLTDKYLLSAQSRLDIITQINAYLTAKTALKMIRARENIIRTDAKRFKIPSSMIKAILFRELICAGFDDIFADAAVESGVRDDSSTGIGQIFARTAMEAEKGVLGYNSVKTVREMWNKLQNDRYNLMYVAMNIKYIAKRSKFNSIGKVTKNNEQKYYNVIKNVFVAYNGSGSKAQRYGKDVLEYFKVFINKAPYEQPYN